MHLLHVLKISRAYIICTEFITVLFTFDLRIRVTFSQNQWRISRLCNSFDTEMYTLISLYLNSKSHMGPTTSNGRGDF